MDKGGKICYHSLKERLGTIVKRGCEMFYILPLEFSCIIVRIIALFAYTVSSLPTKHLHYKYGYSSCLHRMLNTEPSDSLALIDRLIFVPCFWGFLDQMCVADRIHSVVLDGNLPMLIKDFVFNVSWFADFHNSAN